MVLNLEGTGTYVLALRLSLPRNLEIGKLGAVAFPAGWYLYAGSALGPGGLQARLGRHLRRLAAGKRAHWHLDYFREQATWVCAWVRVSDERLECTWAERLRRLPGAEVVAPGFGASDCACRAHLLWVAVLPTDEWFRSVLGSERAMVDGTEVEELLAILISDGDDEARERVALALGPFGVVAVDRLGAILGSGDADARWWAARALAETGEDKAVPPLVGALSDADPDVRACAALGLGRMRAVPAAPALVERLADVSSFVSSIAADAVSMMGEPAVPALVGMLADGGPQARVMAVRALARIKSPAGIGALLAAMEDSSYLVRYYAQEALEAQGVGMVYFAP